MGKGYGCAPETPSLTPDLESNSFTVICFQEKTGTPNGPFLPAICDTETTGLGMECEIIQLSCLVQGKTPFNQYLLPDKKMISESATKIHGVSVSFQNGAKQLHKNGNQLPAVSQAQGLGDFLSFIKEVGCETRVVLVAHNGNRFDFPILLRSMKEQGLLEQFLECRQMLLDSLEVITEEKTARGSHLKECKGKSLATMYEKLFSEQFNAHDSLEDVVSLGRVLHSNKLQQTLEGMVALARQANTFCEDMAMKTVAKGRKSTLHRLGISDVMKDKISKAGLDMNTLSRLYNARGSRTLLTILALPPSKTSAKPRVTETLTVLTSLVNFFATT